VLQCNAELKLRRSSKKELNSLQVERAKNRGYFYRPTILKNVLPEMEGTQKVFGPVAPIIMANDEKEAIRIANDFKFDLGASIWTRI
jgi:acyl-CoA reductase-like NAD-dependent aldehyde dehydrogenase